MPKKHISKAHDHFFKSMMTDKKVARPFFEAHLPAEIVAVTDLNTLELQSSSYIDDMRQESIADLLFKTKIAGHTAYLYLLIDHQSKPDELMPFRSLKYLCNGLDQALKESESKRLPFIVPMVVYHGREPWTYSTDIRDLVDAPRELVDAYFLKPFLLLDLPRIEDIALKQHTWASVMTLTLKHIFAKDMLPILKQILPLMHQVATGEDKLLIEKILTYIIDRGEVSNKETFIDLVHTHLLENIEEKNMGTLGEMWREEGREQGKQQGLQEGIEKGIEKGIEQAMEQTAVRLLAKNMDLATIVELTNLPLEKVEELKKRHLH